MKDEIYRILKNCWCIQTSSLWTIDNPAKGQCGVTSLIINDYFDGTILKTFTVKGWHFYNYINGKRYDFTKSQFAHEIPYSDFASTRDEAFSDTNQDQYNILKKRFEDKLKYLKIKEENIKDLL